MCGQQPGEILRLQRGLQVLSGGVAVFWPGPGSRTVFLTTSLPSCVTGALWRMQGTWPSSSTRLSLRTQMVLAAVRAGAKQEGGR